MEVYQKKHVFQIKKASVPFPKSPLFLFSAIKQSNFTAKESPVSQQVTCITGKRPANLCGNDLLMFSGYTYGAVFN